MSQQLQQIVEQQRIRLGKRLREPLSGTAVQLVRDAGKTMLGYLCADFDLRELKLTGPIYQESMLWRQLKGDPAIRGLLFQQYRVESPVDQNIDSVLAVCSGSGDPFQMPYRSPQQAENHEASNCFE